MRREADLLKFTIRNKCKPTIKNYLMKTQNNYLPPALPIHQLSYTCLSNQAILCKSPDKMKEIYREVGQYDLTNKEQMTLRGNPVQSEINDMDLNYYLSISG
jgi:hypothetical protein